MKRATFCVVAVLLLGCWYQPVSQAQSAKQPLVGTWLLTSEQLNADSSQPTPAQGARGMLVFDAAGYYFEIVDRAVPEALAKDLSEAQANFYRVGGSWDGTRSTPTQDASPSRPSPAGARTSPAPSSAGPSPWLPCRTTKIASPSRRCPASFTRWPSPAASGSASPR